MDDPERRKILASKCREAPEYPVTGPHETREDVRRPDEGEQDDARL